MNSFVVVHPFSKLVASSRSAQQKVTCVVWNKTLKVFQLIGVGMSFFFAHCIFTYVFSDQKRNQSPFI
jgi:hypothetical protein